jgi:aryl-alcohol dehydrogenase-like predicted oxidoreductase
MHIFYLHGFASSARSSKAAYLAGKLKAHGIAVHTPDFNFPDFSTLTITRMIEQTAATIDARPGLTDENFAIITKLREFAEARDHTLLELAMSWLASKSVIASVIAGATKPEQVKANADAASWRLTDDEMSEVNAISAK